MITIYAIATAITVLTGASALSFGLMVHPRD